MKNLNRSLALVLAILITLPSVVSLQAQEIISSATGEGYGTSGSISGDAAWLTMGTAFRVIPCSFNKDTPQSSLALPELRYRYLPFALYLFPEDPNAPPASSPVYYNLHLSPDGRSFVRSTLPSAFNLNDAGLKGAFQHTYNESLTTANPRVSSENLFAKRMMEIQSAGKGFMQVDWSEESHPALVKHFFFSDSNSLFGEWYSWFDDWSEANRAILSDYCAAVSYFFMTHELTGKQYTLPNTSYREEAQLTKISLDTLYQELVTMFEATNADEQNWALIFEPVADFYPQNQQNDRAWTSAAEIAQVMAEKMYSYDLELYSDIAEIQLGELIKPSDGHFSRYQAELTYALRKSGAFNDGFVFSQTRAIFTNNFSNSLGDYQEGKYLLADSLRPERMNESNFLGGWGIVYIKDYVPAAPSVKSVKYALLIDQRSPGVTENYGNLGYFSGTDILPVLSYHDQNRVYRSAYLTSDCNQVTDEISSFIGLGELSSYRTLNYVVSRTLALDKAILPSDFGLEAVTKLKSMNTENLERTEQPVGSDIIGTARYTPAENSIVALTDEALARIVTSLQEESAAQADKVNQTESVLVSAVSQGKEKALHSGQSPSQYADLFKQTKASLTASVVTDNNQPIFSANGQSLVEITGTIPLIVGVKLPEIAVEGRFVTVFLDEDIRIARDEREAFEVSETLCRPIESMAGIRDIVVLGWKTDDIHVNPEAVAREIKEQLATSEEVDLDKLMRNFGAHYAGHKSIGDNICGAATRDPVTGDYDGFTTMTVIVKQDTLDLSIETLESTEPIAGETAIATVCAGNSASEMIETVLTLEISNPHQLIRLPVELQPGLTCFEIPFGTPLEGGSVTLIATINPDRDLVEIDYSNNSKELTIYLVPPQPPYNPPVGCADTQTWTESRTHSRQRCVTINKITSCWIEYCTHTYQYSANISASLTIDDYEGEIKSGYGIAPNASVTGTGPTLIQETKGNNCWGGGPSSTSEASIHWPDQAYFGWHGNQGHSLRDYQIANQEKNIRQESDGIALEHSGTNGSVSSFITAPNALSNTNTRRIYTNVALRDGVHSFLIHIQNGYVQYGEWSGCLATTVPGSIIINGNMYEDDFTGAAP